VVGYPDTDQCRRQDLTALHPVHPVLASNLPRRLGTHPSSAKRHLMDTLRMSLFLSNRPEVTDNNVHSTLGVYGQGNGTVGTTGVIK